VGLNLFWRTFFLLALLLVGSILAWLQTLRALEFEPRTLHTAQQIASLVNLSRAALVHSDAIARVSLIKTMADQEGVRILPREPGDKFTLLDSGHAGQPPDRRADPAPGPGHHRGPERERRKRPVGGLQHQWRPQLAADGPLALQPCGRPHLADLAHHRRRRVAGRRCADCAADQPPAQAAVVLPPTACATETLPPATWTKRW
jgi:hypothetical protein